MLSDVSVSDTSRDDMDHASTPVNSSFLSPIRKFDNLKLDESSDVGEHTLESDIDLVSRPVFVKRKRMDTSDVDMITPRDSNTSSFSHSESTPCPIPAKKKLRFKDDTPVKRLLDLTHSVRTTIDAVDLQLPQHSSDDDWEEVDIQVQQSTPISQSTPANSRPPSPPQQMSTPYETPTVRSRYHARQYEAVAQTPEAPPMASDGDDDHVGDQRIDDPYLNEPSDEEDNSLRDIYDNDKHRLPLLTIPPPYDILPAITVENLHAFYTEIKRDDESLVALLKRERVRWHPDKWVGNNNVDKDVVQAIAMAVNGLISRYDYD